jgi:hypothetical protein
VRQKELAMIAGNFFKILSNFFHHLLRVVIAVDGGEGLHRIEIDDEQCSFRVFDTL